MKKAVYNLAGFNKDNCDIEFMEITLHIKTEKGWVEVNSKNFPKEGIEICIPYPEDSSLFDTFKVVHLRDDGVIEILNPTKTFNGLVVKVYSLSPFAVVYKEAEVAERPSSGNSGSFVPVEDEEKNPNTGAPVVISAAVVAVMGAAVILGKKH